MFLSFDAIIPLLSLKNSTEHKDFSVKMSIAVLVVSVKNWC